MLTIELANALVQSDSDCEFQVMERYSGRGMYGKECVGIIAPSYNEFIRMAITYAFELGKSHDREMFYDLQNFIEDHRQDRMGSDIILY